MTHLQALAALAAAEARVEDHKRAIERRDETIAALEAGIGKDLEVHKLTLRTEAAEARADKAEKERDAARQVGDAEKAWHLEEHERRITLAAENKRLTEALELEVKTRGKMHKSGCAGNGYAGCLVCRSVAATSAALVRPPVASERIQRDAATVGKLFVDAPPESPMTDPDYEAAPRPPGDRKLAPGLYEVDAGPLIHAPGSDAASVGEVVPAAPVAVALTMAAVLSGGDAPPAAPAPINREAAFRRKAQMRAAAAHHLQPAPARKAPRCTATTRRGFQCAMAAFSADGLCTQHAASKWNRYVNQQAPRAAPLSEARPEAVQSQTREEYDNSALNEELRQMQQSQPGTPVDPARDLPATTKERECGRGPWRWKRSVVPKVHGWTAHLGDGRGGMRCGADIPGQIEDFPGDLFRCIHCLEPVASAPEGKRPQHPPEQPGTPTTHFPTEEHDGESQEAYGAEGNVSTAPVREVERVPGRGSGSGSIPLGGGSDRGRRADGGGGLRVFAEAQAAQDGRGIAQQPGTPSDGARVALGNLLKALIDDCGDFSGCILCAHEDGTHDPERACGKAAVALVAAVLMGGK